MSDKEGGSYNDENSCFKGYPFMELIVTLMMRLIDHTLKLLIHLVMGTCFGTVVFFFLAILQGCGCWLVITKKEEKKGCCYLRDRVKKRGKCRRWRLVLIFHFQFNEIMKIRRLKMKMFRFLLPFLFSKFWSQESRALPSFISFLIYLISFIYMWFFI